MRIRVEGSLTHRFVDVNGVRLHIAEQGQERNNELLAPFRRRGTDVPALYVVETATWSPRCVPQTGAAR